MQTVTRLISEFVPTSYDLSLDINRTKRQFVGTLVMSGTSLSGKIFVHAKNLIIDTVTIDGKTGKFVARENDEIELTCNGLSKGKHIVTIGYHGSITDSLHGLYPCYFEHEGVKKELLVTQFESHYARELVPCIDEPEAKAVFDVTVTTEVGVTVLSNTPLKNSECSGSRMTSTFETTPRMSTYLLALVIGELHSLSGKTKNGTEVNVWSTPVHPTKNLSYALTTAIDSIEFFEEYFGVPYPLPKADHVAVPDFDAGAMENWGLITYRESALIVDATNSSLASRQYVTSVVAHELSHQWFGNLVTMRWWNNLWLNESFASVMENIASHAKHPEWNVWLDFSAQDGVAAARRDAIAGVQSVQSDVHHPDEINGLFDGAIVYAKGARLMRMCESYIGEETFRDGLSRYFKQHAFKNTEESDLWNELGAASGKDVAILMTPWISTSGYPVIRARYADGMLLLSQKRFFIGPRAENIQIWPIPLDASSSDIPSLMTERELAVPLSQNGPILLNQNDNSHFIVNYDDELLSRLLAAVRNNELSEVGRMKIIHERVLLARAGEINPSSLIDILSAYVDESSDPVWDMISFAVAELKKFVEPDSGEEQKLKKLVGELSKNLFASLGWDARPDDSPNTIKLRTQILSNMIYAEDPDVLQQAIDIGMSSDIAELPADQRSLIISTIVRHSGNSKFVQELIHRYSTEQSPDLRDDIRAGLTSTKDPSVIKQLLNMMTDKASIRPQDNTHWYIYMLSNRYARSATWQWLQDQWEWITKNFGGDKSFDYYPRYSGQILSTREHFEQFKKFFAPLRNDIALSRTIEMGIADMEGRLEILDTFGNDVRARLNDI